MRPVIVQEFLSLDGVMQAPGDASEFPRGGWQTEFIGDDQLRVMVAQMTSVDALLLGRKTYQAFARVWPTITGLQGLAERLNEMPKFVASRTLRKVEWNATLLQGDLLESLADLKAQPGQGLLVVGSRDLVRYLQRHDLVDEYRLWIHPVVVGAGSHLFDAGLDPSWWNLGDVATTKEGVVILTYRQRTDR